MKFEPTAAGAFPRETFAFDGQVSHLIGDLLKAIGEDPNRVGLVKTPDRVSRMYGELLAGYRMDLETLVNGAIFKSTYDDMVVVTNITFASLCEHHLLPFYGKAHVAYLPHEKIIGLSKIPRIVDMFARRLQVQERMTNEIAHTIDDLLKPRGVAVLIEGAHLCARIRGVKKENVRMITRGYLGAFRTDAHVSEDFMELVRGQSRRI